jgi:SAM-dependent methyltransferase
MDANQITPNTVKRFFDEQAHRGRRLLPDSHTVSGFGTLKKYAEVAMWLCGPARRILDLGCNRGSIEYYVETVLPSEPCPEALLVGIDVSQAAIEQAQALKLGKAAFLPYEGKILPFESGSFDRIVMVEVIEHIVDKPLVFSEMARVLQPGGQLLLTTPNPGCWALRFEQKMWQLLRMLRKKHTPHKDLYIDAKNLSELLADAGFAIRNPEAMYRWPRAFIHLFGWSILPPLPPFLLILYQKFWLSLAKGTAVPHFLAQRLMWTIWIEAERRT